MFTQVPSYAGSIRDGFPFGASDRWDRLDKWIEQASESQLARDNLKRAAIGLSIDRNERRKIRNRAKKVGNLRMLWFLKLNEAVKRESPVFPKDLKICATRGPSICMAGLGLFWWQILF